MSHPPNPGSGTLPAAKTAPFRGQLVIAQQDRVDVPCHLIYLDVSFKHLVSTVRSFFFHARFPSRKCAPARHIDDIAEMAIVFLEILSIVFGWVYFFAWSLSFYPQSLLSWSRKSTSGSTVDFPFLNSLGNTFLLS
jgi:hypothetical protein